MQEAAGGGGVGGTRLARTRADIGATLRQTCTIAAGGILLIWPALANGYSLLFSDTGTFLAQLLTPLMSWDKPWIYGPVLVVLSLKLTLWLPALVQGLCVSSVLWLVQLVVCPPSAAWHLGLCLLLAIGSAAPWFASLLMPDFLAPYLGRLSCCRRRLSPRRDLPDR